MKTMLTLSLAILFSVASLPARASEIPPGLEPVAASPAADPRTVGLTAEDARTLDRVELARLEKTDPDQKGGDAVVTVAVIAAIVILVWLAMDHLDHKP